MGLGIEVLTSSNGLQTIVVSDQRAAEIQVTMYYHVGAVDDPVDRSGMAHLVEHLMFDVVRDDRSVSTRLGSIASYFNASTTRDATVFITRVQPRHLEEVLAIEADRLGQPCSSITEAQFQRERNVVLNEIRERDEAIQVETIVTEALYPADHPYHRSVIGTLDSVGAITREQACAFAASHYGTSNAVLVVSGNVGRAGVEVAVTKTLGTIPRRDVAASRAVPAVVVTPHSIELDAPIDAPALVLAWPSPDDPRTRAKYRAILAAAAQSIDGRIDGSAAVVDLGDARAPMLGLVVEASSTDTYAALVDGVDTALKELPALFERNDIKELDALGFGNTQHGALFRLYAKLENSGERDAWLASDLASGRDPNADVRAAVDGVRELTRPEAITLSRDHFRYSLATVLSLRPAPGKKTDEHIALGPTVDDVDLPRVVNEPDDAHRPMTADLAATVPGARTRTLSNGLEVVLIPITSVPTIDLRMVFHSGSGDEPADKSGVALLAAHALRWNLHYLKDLLLFETAGGFEGVDVEADHTTFSVRGTSNQLDYLLAGLRRWVRDGRYDDDVDAFMRNIKRAHARPDENAAVTDAWRAARFGRDHAYTKAGLMRLADESLDDDDAARFRAEHFTPANATLIVTGNFDPDNVDRWINYLFSDWKGAAPDHASMRATIRPASIATPANLTQVELKIAMPASAGVRTSQLVAAQMLSEIARDVRDQLGASYDISAQLSEARLSTAYVLAGRIEAHRAAEAMKLLEDRLARLRSDNSEAARLFVIARNRVVMELSAATASPAEVARRVENDVSLGRAPFSDLATAAAVRDLTVDQMPSVLAELDLARAAIAMQGPEDDVQHAFDVLGRKPQSVTTQPPPDPNGPMPEASFVHAFRDTAPHGLADPITSPRAPLRFVWTIAAGLSFASIDRTAEAVVIKDSCIGPAVAADVGYQYRSLLRAGLHLTLESLAGTNTVTNASDVSFTALDIGPFVQHSLPDGFWLGVVAGAHLESDVATHAGMFFGGELGLELIPIRRRWLGMFARYELVSGTESGTVTLGLGYRP
jgi:zinc protease